MTYGFNRGLFIENGPAAQAASTASARPATRFLAWRAIDSKRRLEIVEDALKQPANDTVDGLPLAL